MSGTSNRLSGTQVLVLGGTSGMGLAAARRATALGAHVTVVGSDPVRAANAAAEHGLAAWRSADVTRPETVAAALADVAHVDHLALLAGSFVVGKVLEAEVSQLQRAFDERIWATVHTLRTLGDRLDAHGSVTLVSGTLAERPNASGTAILAAASAAVEGLARGLALELAPRRVNTISPGPIDTPLLAKAVGAAARDAYVAQLEKTLPVGRLGTADEAAEAIVFLMNNGFMNGATLHIDGGSRFV